MATSNRNAHPYKPYIGKLSYSLTAVEEILKRDQVTFDVDINNGALLLNDFNTQFMFLFNGKFGGGGMMLNPLALINDGLMELNFYDGLVEIKKAMDLFDGAKKGGL